MRYLVDGYNVIRRIPRFREIEARDGLEAGRDALVRALLGSPLLARAAVTVVFDGAAGGSGSVASPHPRLRVRFSHAPENADAAIVSLLVGDRKQETVVVTADLDLQWEARKRGVSVETPETWLRKMRSPSRKKGRAAEPPDAGKPAPSGGEVEWGLAVFGDVTERVTGTRKSQSTKPEHEIGRPSSSEGESAAETRLKRRRRERHLRRSKRRRS